MVGVSFCVVGLASVDPICINAISALAMREQGGWGAGVQVLEEWPRILHFVHFLWRGIVLIWEVCHWWVSVVKCWLLSSWWKCFREMVQWAILKRGLDL